MHELSVLPKLSRISFRLLELYQRLNKAFFKRILSFPVMFKVIKTILNTHVKVVVKV